MVVKFVDDTTVAELIHNSDERAYRDQVQELVEWCKLNNLELDVSKTKEIIIDFPTTRKNDESPLVINDSVEIVDTFKFLGIHISNDLWSEHVNRCVKAQQRLFFLRRLRSFGISRSVMCQFDRAVIESVLTLSITVR